MKYNEEEIKDSHRRYFFITTIVVFLISFSIFSYYEYSNRLKAIERLRKSEMQVVSITDSSLTNDLKLITSDLRYLHNAFENNLSENIDYDEIANNWLEFSRQRKIYDQIRYISVNGYEKIRINNDSEKGCNLVPPENLQNKSDRYYFNSSIQLEKDSIYLSPMDLNIENGVVEVPYKPMLRLLMPVYKNGEVKGVIVLNYLVSELLNNLSVVAKSSLGNISLLNSNGFYLYSDNPEKNWGFMFDKDSDNFKFDFPNVWERLKNGEEEILNSSGYFFSHKVELANMFDINDFNEVSIADSYWLVVSIIPRNSTNDYYFYDNFFDLLLDIISRNYVVYLLLLLASIAIGVLVFINDRYHTRLRNYSRYDSLTSIFNRGYGMSLINKSFAINKNFPISLCYIDINGLKQVNDNLGHNLGSELIISVTSLISESINKEDYVIRLGGDEIIIVFLSKTKEKADAIWNKIYGKYNKVNETENRPYIISVSHGIEQFNFEDNTDPDVAINIVDEIMYEEKQRIKKNISSFLR